jgi:hypothetical protein
MPEELDPAWEYWTPDPEIAEILAEASRLSGFALLGVEESHAKKLAGNVGFYFGRGNPNYYRSREARERPEVVRESKCRDVSCLGCGVAFRQSRPNLMCCSRECAHEVAAETRRVRAAEWTCERCGKWFEPNRVGQVFCSPACGGLSASDAEPRESGCLVCGDPVPESTSRNGIPRVYCSVRCKRVFVNRRYVANKRFLFRTRSGAVGTSPGTLSVGDSVVIDAPDNPRLHGTGGEVLELAAWGAHLRAPAAAAGRFRAAWGEMLILNPVPRLTGTGQETAFTG